MVLNVRYLVSEGSFRLVRETGPRALSSRRVLLACGRGKITAKHSRELHSRLTYTHNPLYGCQSHRESDKIR